MINLNKDSLNIVSILLIGIALSMDAFAVGLSCGITKRRFNFNYPFKISFSFGFFQFGMVVIGYLIGIRLLNFIKDYDHWVAFFILFFVGIKMIYESFKNECEKKINIDNFITLLILSIATSIDAFAVGISLSLLKIKILFPSIFIGITTFTLTLISIYSGFFLGKIFKRGAEIFGGLILISIGIKILLEHVF
ncbi:MAG: manganese efflux pump MntP family protein [Caldisericia bacterium]|jgi:putative Mn2+ efflux pump MntP|nr:manganese efflux pump MntP family protein [Caldisericia bacterium]